MIKKILASYILSLPVLVLGIALLVQASEPVSADIGSTILNSSGRTFLMIIGFILILAAIASIIFRYTFKKER